jgi:hypothetical protein
MQHSELETPRTDFKCALQKGRGYTDSSSAAESHHSITSLARAISIGEIFRKSNALGRCCSHLERYLSNNPELIASPNFDSHQAAFRRLTETSGMRSWRQSFAL